MVFRCDFRRVTRRESREWRALTRGSYFSTGHDPAGRERECIFRHPNTRVREAQAVARVFAAPCDNPPGCTRSRWQQHHGGHHHIPLPVPRRLAPPPAQQLGEESQQRPQPPPGVTPMGSNTCRATSLRPRVPALPSEPRGCWCHSCEHAALSGGGVEDRCAFEAALEGGALPHRGCARSLLTGHDKALPARCRPRDATVAAKSSGSGLNCSFHQVSSAGCKE